MSTKLAPLPHPSDPRFLDAVYERLAVHTGQRGLPIDRMVTFRDLVEAGIATPKVGGGGAGVGAGGIVQPAAGLPNMTVPPPVSGLQVGGAFTRAILSWSPPAHGNHSLVEVARASVPDIGMAVTIGSSSANTYIDVVGGGFTGYWWVRNVSSAGVRGPWSPPVTATTPASHDEILKNITSAEWQPETAYSIFNPVAPTSEVKIGGVAIRLVAVSAGATGAIEPDWATEVASIGDTVLDGSVTWLAVEAGKIPFLIDPVSGLVVIDGAAIREASIESLQVKDGFFDTMTAAKGVLGEANISIANIFNALIDNYIQSSNYSAGSTGWRISANGDAEFNNLLLRGIFQNNDGDRYIDMRPGATEGDFVLGDVEGQNFVSFKFEPEFGSRILRIRGDIALRNYAPGNILIHDNTSTVQKEWADEPGLYLSSSADFNSKYIIADDMFDYPASGTVGNATFRSRVVDIMDFIRDSYATPTPAGTLADYSCPVKETAITRAGVATVNAVASGRLFIVSEDGEGLFSNNAWLVIPVFVLTIVRGGNLTNIKAFLPSTCSGSWGSAFGLASDFDLAYWTTDYQVAELNMNVALQPGDILGIQTKYSLCKLTQADPFSIYLDTAFLGAPPDPSEPYLNNGQFRVRGEQIRLTVDFFPEETSLL